MARLALHYIPTNSLLHRWDPRCKFFSLILITSTLLYLNILWLILNSILIGVTFFLARLPFRRILRDLRGFMVIIFFIFFFQIIFSKGDGIWGLPISKEGILIGLFTSWRLFLLIGYAVIFTSITRPREVRDAIIWLFKPIPFISGKRIGLMVSLSMRFFSRVLDQAEEIRLAGKSRFSEFSKNPFRKIKFLAFPILRRSFLEVEEVSFALASRGYNENYPIDLPKLPIIHLVPFFLLLICIIFFYVFTKKFFAYKVFI